MSVCEKPGHDRHPSTHCPGCQADAEAMVERLRDAMGAFALRLERLAGDGETGPEMEAREILMDVQKLKLALESSDNSYSVTDCPETAAAMRASGITPTPASAVCHCCCQPFELASSFGYVCLACRVQRADGIRFRVLLMRVLAESSPGVALRQAIEESLGVARPGGHG